MRTYNPPHKAQDETKLAEMIGALQRGENLPPIVVCGEQAFCGSHRIEAYNRAYRLRESLDEAWELVPQEIPVVELSDEDYRSACEYLDVEYLDEAHDYNEIATAIHETTTDDEVRAAMADQMD
ncbi:hypothetical protein [Petrachloros mirabilis]